MAAFYDFYPNPPFEKAKGRLHARAITSGTIGTNELAEEIQSRSTISTADVVAVLSSLKDVAIDHFKDGHRIHIDGFGYFQITLSCPPVQTENEIRAESIRFKSVVFRPEKELTNKLKHIPFERVARKNHSLKHTEDKMEEKLARYFSVKPFISRIDFQRLFGYTKSTANRHLKKLANEGKLRKSGLHRFPVYEPVEKHA